MITLIIPKLQEKYKAISGERIPQAVKEGAPAAERPLIPSPFSPTPGKSILPRT